MQPEYEFRTARSIVYQLLKNEPKCRENDKWLCFRVYEEIAKKHNKKIFIPFEIFTEFPSFETISRIRRKIQHNDKQFLPNKQTIQRRNEKEKWVREWSQKEFAK